MRLKRNQPSTYFRPRWGRARGTDEWQANLASVGVAAQHQRDCPARREGQQLVDVVEGVAHQDDRLMRQVAEGGRDGRVRTWTTDHGIVDPGEPEVAAGTFYGQA
jgi:hypothetical protein